MWLINGEDKLSGTSWLGDLESEINTEVGSLWSTWWLSFEDNNASLTAVTDWADAKFVTGPDRIWVELVDGSNECLDSNIVAKEVTSSGFKSVVEL